MHSFGRRLYISFLVKVLLAGATCYCEGGSVRFFWASRGILMPQEKLHVHNPTERNIHCIICTCFHVYLAYMFCLKYRQHPHIIIDSFTFSGNCFNLLYIPLGGCRFFLGN